MQTRKLGNSDMEITPVGFGAWAVGGGGWEFGWGPQKDRESIEAIHRALDLGINWIDTAAAYGLGHSEEVVARALEGWSGARPYVFTKCGLRWDDDGKVHRVLKADTVREECENSLRRLGVEAIDLYQIHWPTKNPAENEAGWTTLAQLQREGKVRWIGLSNWNVEQMQMARQIAPITSLQPPYSLIRRGIEEEILPFCKREGIGVIVYSPMASGMLTGAMTRERAANLPDNDWRSTNKEFQEPNLSRNLELVESLREIGAVHGRSPGEAAIAWTLRHPAVTGAIVGGRNAGQVEGTAGAAGFRLGDDEIEALDVFVG
jgi:aryl-alcohol dehydrogenase-like predicted oxidoreductase